MVAASRTFAREHPEFLRHFVGVLSRVGDSFIDFLGEEDTLNTARWVPMILQYSLIPSMVDALVLEEETHSAPSEKAMFLQREALELFEDNDAFEQYSCTLMGGGTGDCAFPTVQHWSLSSTAEFLVNQKVLAHMGPMKEIGASDNCKDPASFCGGDIIDGSYLRAAREECSNCLLVGRYSNIVPPVSSTKNGPDLLLRALELNYNATKRSIYADDEIGRHSGDSTCMIGGPVKVGASFPVTGEFGDGANGEQGRSYSDDMYCEWEIRGVDCENQGDQCESLVQIEFSRVRLWSGDVVRIYADPQNECTGISESSYLIAKVTGFDNTPPSIRARGCLRVVFESDSNKESFYATDNGDGFYLSYNRNHDGCLSNTDCNNKECNAGLCKCEQLWGANCSTREHCFGTSRMTLKEEQARVVANSHYVSSSSVLQADLKTLLDTRALEPSQTYPNDAFCAIEIEVPNGYSFVKVEILYDVSKKAHPDGFLCCCFCLHFFLNRPNQRMI